MRLIDPAPAGGRVVQLAAVDPGLRTATSVTIPQGQTSAEFSIVSNDVTELQNARVVATLGDSTATASMVVKPLAIKAFALSAATVKGGVSVEGTVTLDEVVGVNTLVTVESADPAVVVVPSSTTVVKGGKARTFTIKTKAVTAAKYVKITVTKNGTSTYRTLKVTP
ncbi:hypothetical protein EON79_17395 [bacterium]|nr:MAG: hypothetical protein EON79_17395 [bacterium]